jgi:hypothetical protein
MGQKRATYDAAGNLINFYDDAISPAPQGVPTIALTTDEWQAWSARQSAYIVQNGALVLAPVDPNAGLAEAKVAVKATIRAERDALLLLTPFNGKQFQTDTNSKIQIMVIAGQSELLPSAAKWRTADNTYADMTLDSFRQLMAAIMTREGKAFTNSAAHQDAVDALTTLEAVNSYDFSGGWPE